MRLERTVRDRELAALMIPDVDLDRLKGKPSRVARLERLKHEPRSGRLPGLHALEVRVTRHAPES